MKNHKIKEESFNEFENKYVTTKQTTDSSFTSKPMLIGGDIFYIRKGLDISPNDKISFTINDFTNISRLPVIVNIFYDVIEYDDLLLKVVKTNTNIDTE